MCCKVFSELNVFFVSFSPAGEPVLPLCVFQVIAVHTWNNIFHDGTQTTLVERRLTFSLPPPS